MSPTKGQEPRWRLFPTDPIRDFLAAVYPWWYSPRTVSADGPVKALLIAVAQDPAPAIASLQHLTPEMVCFFIPESRKPLVESEVPAQLPKMPQRWDWIISSDPDNFAQCHKELAAQFPSLLKTWSVSAGELTIDLTSATPSMAAAMTLVGFPYTAKVFTLSPAGPEQASDPKATIIGGSTRLWNHSNPWDEEATRIRQEGCDYFNQGTFGAAARVFRLIEARASGGLKPLYRALADIAEGYRLWEEFHYRKAWEKLKSATKALDLASAWGGPAGMGNFLKAVKDNLRFLEQIVLDPQAIKTGLGYDLLAQAKRRTDRHRDVEVGVRVLLRALEVLAQTQLHKQYHITSWDVNLDQLPESLKETCRVGYLNEVDGKYRLPMLAQFQTLAGLGDVKGQTFMNQWPKMKSLIDAADHAVLGHGFEAIKTERFHQLYDMILKLCEINEADLPKFPTMAL